MMEWKSGAAGHHEVSPAICFKTGNPEDPAEGPGPDYYLPVAHDLKGQLRTIVRAPRRQWRDAALTKTSSVVGHPRLRR